MTVAERVEAIRERVARSAERAGRSAHEVTLVAVCKKQPYERIAAAHQAGVRDFGENTAQGLRDSATRLDAEGRSVCWHFVGGLQRNKINTVLPHAPIIHSIDRLSLAEAIAKRAETAVPVLVQVNVGREPQKGGVLPEAAVELACAVGETPGLVLRGLMTVPPADEDPRPHFEALRALSQALQGTHGQARDLSMGMSDDFEIAIDCGATIVRVGTALFGPRDNPRKGDT